jgi:protocatechuate 3,4-dioxygenase beta subunit
VPAIADSASVTLSKTTGVQAATILVTQKNATSTANESMTATISGPGLLGTGSSTSAASTGRAVTVKNTEYVTVWSDGTSGEATITIVGNTSGLTLGVEKVTFFDTKPASVTATVKKAYILAGTAEVAKVFAVVVKDAAGNPVTNATVTAAATDTTTTVGGAATCGSYDATDKVYYCAVKGLSATKFGKVNYTVTASDGAAVPTKATSTADVTFSAGVATKVSITGPASAAPGEKIKLTLTATDANGYPVADQSYEGAAAAGIFWSTTSTAVPDYTVSTFKPFNSGETFTTVSGVAELEIAVPVSGIKAGATWTLAGDGISSTGAIDKSIAKTTVSYEVAIADPRTDAATDAANEASQAAQDATDAALAAADAADEATTKAQEAVDAVATLSAEVTKMINALKAQIKTLSNLVTKIAKKVRA